MLSAFPFLGVLRGPLFVPALALLVAAVLARRLAGTWARIAETIVGLSPRALFRIAFAAYLLLGQYYVSGLQATGDEPHYLLMAQSLWREHDLDLQDNYARQDFLEYTPGPLETHYAAPRKDGRPFPAHSPGLPALLAPLYAIGGRRLCVALMALAAAAMTVETRALAASFTSDARALFFAWAAAAGPPAAFYSFHLYTETLAALCLVVALRRLLSSSSAASAGIAATACAFLPWLHVKMIPAAAALGVVALVRLRGRALVAFVAVAALAALAFAAYYRHVFGVPTPLAIYGGVPKGTAGASPVSAVVGLLLDRSFGLLPYAPLFVLALAGLSSLLKGRDAWALALVGVAVLVPVLVWRMWWGGMCPAARFLVPLVPVLSVAVALRVAAGRTGLVRWAPALASWGAGLLFVAGLQPARALLLNRRNNPTRLWQALSGETGTPIERYLPSIVSSAPAEWRVAAVWLLLLGLLLLLDALAVRRSGVDRWFAGLALPAALLAIAGVSVDAWARLGSP